MANPTEAAFYDQRWSTSEISRAKQIRGRAILAAIEGEGRRDLQILELGCGTGWLCSEVLPFGQSTGLDLSPQAIEAAQRRFPGPRFVCADVTQWRPDRAYDVVISHEVIEHIQDQAGHVALAYEALAPGGLFIVTTPNAFAAHAAIAAVRHAYERQPLENWLYKDELRGMLRGAGFTIDALTTIVPTREYRHRAVRLLVSKRLDAVAGRLGSRDAWASLKGKLGLNDSLFALARRPAA